MHWRRTWQPTPVFLPGESQGWGSPGGCRLWGRAELDTIESLHNRRNWRRADVPPAGRVSDRMETGQDGKVSPQTLRKSWARLGGARTVEPGSEAPAMQAPGIWQEAGRSQRGRYEVTFFFYFILLYNAVLVLPYINMNPPRVYMCSPS